MLLNKKMLTWLLAGLLLIILNLTVTRSHYKKLGMHVVISSDAIGYYQYLPYFMKHDIEHQHYACTLENGYNLNKYTMGVAILLSPFFISAYTAEVLFTNDYNLFGSIYGNAIALAAAFYVSLGLLFLFKFLKNIFNSTTAFFCTLIVYLGTNLFYYAGIEPGMSHVYSFFCFAAFMYYLQQLFKEVTFKHALLTSVFLSLAVLIRPTSIFMGLMLLLYDVYSLNDLRGRFLFLFKHKFIIPLFVVCGFIIFIPQMLYWYKVTGHYFLFSYGCNNEAFIYWKSPKIFLVLFGVQCGWLPFTPVMTISLVGLVFLIAKRILHGPAIAVVFSLILYSCSSWWAYNFSCAFGYRSFIEYYTILIIPIGYIIHKQLQSGSKKRTILLNLLVALVVWFNLKLTYKYDPWPFCNNDFTWSEYLNKIVVFFKF